MTASIRRSNSIWRCAVSDLAHEWPLNLCVILSIAALLFPLAVLYGLKYGAVSILESRLKNDPRSRELRPAASGFYSREWIAEQLADPAIGFAVGLPRSVTATVRVVHGSDPIDASILPTGPGDPLLESGGLKMPSAGECVISAALAREARLKTGDDLEFLVARRNSNDWQEVSARLKVAGVLPDFALDYPAILTRMEIAEAVEDFLDGFAVPFLGWQGEAALARAAYDGALVFSKSKESSHPEALAEMVRDRLGGTGFTTVDAFNAEIDNREVLYLTNANSMIDDENLNLLRAKLDGQGIAVVPWLKDRMADAISGADNVSVQILPWSEDVSRIGHAPADAVTSSRLPWTARTAGDSEEESTLTLVWPGITESLQVPLRVIGGMSAQPEALWLPAREAGLLRRALERGVVIQDGELVYTRRGYASFRIAAKRLEDVLPLQQRLESSGTRILAETQRIADIQMLGQQLSRIFTLFAAVAGVGAVTCLFAIAFSAAERKKRVLAFLQILGATKGQAARFPLYQCLILSLAGAGAAWMGHAIFSTAVDRVFQSRLLPGESLSHLPLETAGWALGVLLLISLGCYLILIPRFIGMPLGEAAREP